MDPSPLVESDPGLERAPQVQERKPQVRDSRAHPKLSLGRPYTQRDRTHFSEEAKQRLFRCARTVRDRNTDTTCGAATPTL
jgi:hypothetical protein